MTLRPWGAQAWGLARHRLAWSPAAALAVGAVASLGFAPYGMWPLTVLGCAWFVAASLRIRRAGRALMIGGVFGFGYFLSGQLWMFSGVENGHAPVLAILGPMALMAYMSIFPALAMLASSQARLPELTRAALLAPSLWMLGEWLRHQGTIALPNMAIGYTQVPDGPLAGYAPLLGMLGVGFLMFAIAGLSVWAIRQRQPGARFGALLAITLIVAAGYGLKRVEWTQPAGSPVTASLLQGDAPMLEKFAPGYVRHSLETYMALVGESRGRLIVMPETAIPLFERQIPGELTAYVQSYARQRDSDIIVSHFRDKPGNATGEYYSSARVYGASGVQTYDKRHLLPFGEFIPFPSLLRPIYERIAKVVMLDTSPGRQEDVDMVAGGNRIALRMCYEDFFGSEHRPEVATAGFLVLLVNDAWDNETGPMEQHLQISRARALESGKPALRAANTGWTVAIDERGHVVDALPAESVGVLETTVQPREGVTPYVRFGDALPLSMAGFMLVAASLYGQRQSAGHGAEGGDIC